MLQFVLELCKTSTYQLYNLRLQGEVVMSWANCITQNWK